MSRVPGWSPTRRQDVGRLGTTGDLNDESLCSRSSGGSSGGPGSRCRETWSLAKSVFPACSQPPSRWVSPTCPLCMQESEVSGVCPSSCEDTARPTTQGFLRTASSDLGYLLQGPISKRGRAGGQDTVQFKTDIIPKLQVKTLA